MSQATPYNPAARPGNGAAIGELSFHPIAAVFPLMTEAELEELADDIRENGLRVPIVLHPDGAILDGRNRYLACRRAGIEPEAVAYDGNDPVGFVVSLNLRRRHLDGSQRAMVGARIATLPHGGDRRSDQAANLPVEIPTQAETAELLAVSGRSIRHARAVLEHGSPDVIAAVEEGDLAVSLVANTLRRAKQNGQPITSVAELKAAMREAWREMDPPAPERPATAEEQAERERHKQNRERGILGVDTFGVVFAVVQHAAEHPVAAIVPVIDKWTRLNILDRLPPAIEYLIALNDELSRGGNR